jgi:redox-sensing transcriptional repressor
VTSILNFAPVVLNVPSGVDVRKVDLSIELQILAFHAQRRGAMLPPRDRGPGSRPVDGLPGGGSAPGEDVDVDVVVEASKTAGLGAADDYEAGAQAVGT